MLTLQPLRFPRPVPIPIWTDDYADLPERIRRTGRLDTEEVWLAHSGDSFEAFCSRHGDYNFAWDWKLWDQPARAARDRGYGAVVRQQQEAWEAARRERERIKQAAADREWQAIEIAKERWSRRKPGYAMEPYRIITVGVTGTIDGVELLGGRSYWVPLSIAVALRAYVKTHNLTTVA